MNCNRIIIKIGKNRQIIWNFDKTREGHIASDNLKYRQLNLRKFFRHCDNIIAVMSRTYDQCDVLKLA